MGVKRGVLYRTLGVAILGALFAWPVFAESASGIPGVVAAGVTPELVSEMFLNTEGPLGVQDGSLYFSDTDANLTYRLDTNGRITIERFDTGHTFKWWTGLIMFDETDGRSPRMTRHRNAAHTCNFGDQFLRRQANVFEVIALENVVVHTVD